MVSYPSFCLMSSEEIDVLDVGWPKTCHPDAKRLNDEFYLKLQTMRKQSLNNQGDDVCQAESSAVAKDNSSDESGSWSDGLDCSDSDEEIVPIPGKKYENIRSPRCVLLEQAENNLKKRPSIKAIKKNNEIFEKNYEIAQQEYCNKLNAALSKNAKSIRNENRNALLEELFTSYNQMIGENEIKVLVRKYRFCDDIAIENKKQTILHYCLRKNNFAFCLERLGNDEGLKRIGVILKFFIGREGIAVNVPDYKGETILHLAMKRFYAQAIALLAAFGANPNAQNSNGDTPLLAALKFNTIRMLYSQQEMLFQSVSAYLALQPNLDVTNYCGHSIISLLAVPRLFIPPYIRYHLREYITKRY